MECVTSVCQGSSFHGVQPSWQDLKWFWTVTWDRPVYTLVLIDAVRSTETVLQICRGPAGYTGQAAAVYSTVRPHENQVCQDLSTSKPRVLICGTLR